MTTIRNAVNIRTSPTALWATLTQIDGLRRWHRGTVEGEVAPGSLLILRPKPGLRFDWHTTVAEPAARLVLEAAGSSSRKVSFILSDLPEGRIRLDVEDEGWDGTDPSMAICSTEWGAALDRLRSHLEEARPLQELNA
ncbi:SRPBCC domain-containing protein [Mangrovicoccus sp. HB161399]|uniref:SRPBCC family protein n=1 Tax=Mangrovicoccus sp. HB161399 TaxID=2720392 RepID=UPI0015534306|nr:SRPBCC domain-containing protein [Mangrovicoccus sp. HB161399]